jgi:hypothetical protein
MGWMSRTPWPVATTAFGTTALVLLAAALPSTEVVLPFVGRVAELALAGAAAYLIDDPAAALTTVTPTGTWRRRVPALTLGTTLLGTAWAVVLLVLAWRDVLPPALAASGELLVLGLVAMAVAAVLVNNGDPEPGALVGPALVLVGLSLLILETVVRHPILVPWDEPPGAGLLVAWTGAGLLALVVVLRAARDTAGTRAVRRRSGLSPGPAGSGPPGRPRPPAGRPG